VNSLAGEGVVFLIETGGKLGEKHPLAQGERSGREKFTGGKKTQRNQGNSGLVTKDGFKRRERTASTKRKKNFSGK